MSNYTVTVEGVVPLLMHRFIGQDASKRAVELPDKECADAFTYRMNGEGSNLAAPGVWFGGALIASFIANAGSKAKTKVSDEVTPSITVSEELIDLGVKKFDISKKTIPIKKNGKIAAMQFVVRPSIPKWKCTFTLQSTLDRPDEDIHAELKRAGKYQGVGSGRKIGYGRFEVTNFKRIKD